MKIHLSQLNPVVGDLIYNKSLILSEAKRACDNNAKILVTPELSLTGYPPEDLLLDSEFIDSCKNCIIEIAEKYPQLMIVVGYPNNHEGNLYNAASVLHNGKIAYTYHKNYLPNYGVFDEKRYFTEGKESTVFECDGNRLAIIICEDFWVDDPIERLEKLDVNIILCINASPYDLTKQQKRIENAKKKISRKKVLLVYLNTLGGQDDLLFDGGSFIFDGINGLIREFPQFKQISESIDLSNKKKSAVSTYEDMDILLNGLILSLHDYLKKNNISKVFLGLSGGIDSALVIYIASKAIDVKNIYSIMMPSKYTSKASLEDAEELAKSLGVHYKTKSIDDLFNNLKNSFDNDFKGMPEDIAEENFQARIRGITLMGFANKFKGMVLATSNKSELAVGYSTIYGDMVGGFCVLKDVPKTLVYKLAKHINKKKEIIPDRIITREPTAELKFNQTDQDNLPSYDILDSIINMYIEQKISPNAIVREGFDSQVVKKVVELIHGNEFKRRQSAPGPKITSKAFSVDRRYPITNRYKPKI
mgnify:FL=1|tara:strand:+ start:33056 stop:34651 length:1596 start_codon:yes stop_codon:yes gene_type:complete